MPLQLDKGKRVHDANYVDKHCTIGTIDQLVWTFQHGINVGLTMFTGKDLCNDKTYIFLFIVCLVLDKELCVYNISTGTHACEDL